MRKIINNHKYDTDTAEVVASDDNGFYQSNFRWMCESLYQKTNGEYFLHGEGGPASQYRIVYGDGHSYASGARIIPLTEDEAKTWAQEHMSVGAYEEQFGPVEE